MSGEAAGRKHSEPDNRAGMARRRRRGRRRDHGEPGRAAAAREAGGCCRTCCARTGPGCTTILLLIVIANLAALAGPWLVGVGIDRIPQLTTHARRGTPHRRHRRVRGDRVWSRPPPPAPISARWAGSAPRWSSSSGAGCSPTSCGFRCRSTSATRPAGSSPARSPTSTRSPTCSTRAWTRWCRHSCRCCWSGAGMLLLDWPLALVVLAGFGPLTWLTVWFRRESANGLPADTGDDRAGHRVLRGDVRRHPGGPGVPR